MKLLYHLYGWCQFFISVCPLFLCFQKSVDESDSETSFQAYHTHVRHRSDISPDFLRLIHLEEGRIIVEATCNYLL